MPSRALAAAFSPPKSQSARVRVARRVGSADVCDSPASGCPKWLEHCAAVHSQPVWQQRRREWAAGCASAQAGGASAAPLPRAGAPSGAASRGTAAEPWTCARVLKMVEQVYPVEPAEPAGFLAGASLRPYQKQSLGFMLDVERSTDSALRGRRKAPGDATTSDAPRGGWLCAAQGIEATLAQC